LDFLHSILKGEKEYEITMPSKLVIYLLDGGSLMNLSIVLANVQIISLVMSLNHVTIELQLHISIFGILKES
jgi:hypothetical protein